MSIRSILVPVLADDAGDEALTLAIQLAERLGSRLLGFGAPRLARETLVEGYASGLLMQAQFEAAQQELALAEEKFGRMSAALSIATGWRCALNSPQQALAVAARAVDLIVIHHQRERLASTAGIPSPGVLALQAGRPVLVAPPGARVLELTNIMIAWKDTREARRALSDALPFLHMAAHVTLVMICEDGCAASAQAGLEDVADGLRAHGLDAEIVVRERQGEPPAELLLGLAKDGSADLLVAGAYGHTRLGEWAFGGVTKALLEGSERALLLSH